MLVRSTPLLDGLAEPAAVEAVAELVPGGEQEHAEGDGRRGEDQGGGEGAHVDRLRLSNQQRVAVGVLTGILAVYQAGACGAGTQRRGPGGQSLVSSQGCRSAMCTTISASLRMLHTSACWVAGEVNCGKPSEPQDRGRAGRRRGAGGEASCASLLVGGPGQGRRPEVAGKVWRGRFGSVAGHLFLGQSLDFRVARVYPLSMTYELLKRQTIHAENGSPMAEIVTWLDRCYTTPTEDPATCFVLHSITLWHRRPRKDNHNEVLLTGNDIVELAEAIGVRVR